MDMFLPISWSLFFEAASFLSRMSCSLQLPEEAKELDKELRQITKEKNEAVRGQDFEKVSLSLSLSLIIIK